MAVLTSQVERGSDEFARRRERMTALVAELRERTAEVARGGGEAAVERHRSRGKLTARERIDRLVDPDSAFLELNALAAYGPLRRPGAERRHRHRRRRRRGPRVRDRRQRRDGQGRLLLPAHREEAPAGAGGGRAEPPAVPVPRRLRRRVPAASGRGLSRPRALRAHLLQPGADVRAGDPADRGRDGLVHRRRRVRAGDERRDDHRPRHRHDLHRRPAAREGRHRPGRDGGGARRRRRAHAPLGRRRPLRDLGRARARARARDRAQPARAPARAAVGARPSRSRRRSTRATSTA